jgi:hypothetical protein
VFDTFDLGKLFDGKSFVALDSLIFQHYACMVIKLHQLSTIAETCSFRKNLQCMTYELEHALLLCLIVFRTAHICLFVYNVLTFES